MVIVLLPLSAIELHDNSCQTIYTMVPLTRHLAVIINYHSHSLVSRPRAPAEIVGQSPFDIFARNGNFLLFCNSIDYFTCFDYVNCDANFILP